MMKKLLIVSGFLLILFAASLILTKEVYAACDASVCNIPLDVRKVTHITGLPSGEDPCEYYSGNPPDAFHTVCCESHIRDPETEWGFSWSKWCTPPGVERPPCDCNIPAGERCPEGYEEYVEPDPSTGMCLSCGCRPKAPPEEPKPFDPCKYMQEGSQEKKDCANCFRPISQGGRGGTWTALGCIPVEKHQDFIAWLLARAIGIAGGIAFLLMIFASFQIITSAGDPQKLQRGKELLTSAIAGLLLIIFSLFLLQLIGVRILQIPGFGTP